MSRLSHLFHLIQLYLAAASLIKYMLTHRCVLPTYVSFNQCPLFPTNYWYQPLSAATFSAATPDTRALLEQEELYFDIERHIGTQLRRSRSFGALLSNTDSSRRPRSPLRANGLVQGSRRPASLPGDSRLSDAYRAMNADVRLFCLFI